MATSTVTRGATAAPASGSQATLASTYPAPLEPATRRFMD